MTMTESLVTMENISFTYDERPILNNIHFSVPRGAFMGLVGPNGGGKTTLIKLILGLERPDTGQIRLFEQPIEDFKQWSRLDVVSQKSSAFSGGFPATVYEVVSMGLTAKIGYGKFLKKHHKDKIMQTIDQVGMLPYAKENIGNLSGGQQQRIFIARSLVSEPEFLILDEPTVGVDTENVRRFYGLLHQLHTNRNLTLLLVTHDTGTMTPYATDVACLNKEIRFHGSPDEFQNMPEKDLSDAYGYPIRIVKHDH